MFLWLLVLVLILLFIFVRRSVNNTFAYWETKGIPYVKPCTVLLGNLTPVVFRRKHFAEFLEDLYKQYSTHRYFGIYQFLRPTLVVKDIDLIKQICIKEFDKFPDHTDFLPKESDPFWKCGIFAREGKEWHDMRTILSPAFTSSKMKAMFSLMTECAQKFTNHFESENLDIVTVEMKEALTKLTNDVIASCAFGFQCDSLQQPQNEFYVMGKEAFDFSGLKGFKFFGTAISPTLMKLFKVTMFSEKVRNFFRRIVKETIAYREKTGLVRPDMIHLLKEAQKGTLKNDSDVSYNYTDSLTADRDKKIVITDEDITCQAAVFFFGGYDTVASLMCNFVYELAVYPDIQDKVIEEIDQTLGEHNGKVTYEALMGMKYLDMVVSETLRLWTPAIFLNRKCVKAFTVEPVQKGENPLYVESDTDIIIPTFAIHRDPRFYPDPTKFDPERFSDENKNNIPTFAYLPFGIGPRFCLGNRFALLEIKTGLFYLLSRFKVIPVEKTSIPFVLDKGSIPLQHKHGYWLGLKKRFK